MVTGSGERVVVIGDSWSAGLGLDRPGPVLALAAAGPGPRGRLLRHRLQREGLAVRPGLVRRPRPGRTQERRRPGRRRGRPQRLRPQPGRDQGRLRAGDGLRRAVPHVVVVGPATAPSRADDGAARRPAARPPLATSTASPTSRPSTSSCPTWPTACTCSPPGTGPSATRWPNGSPRSTVAEVRGAPAPSLEAPPAARDAPTDRPAA